MSKTTCWCIGDTFSLMLKVKVEIAIGEVRESESYTYHMSKTTCWWTGDTFSPMLKVKVETVIGKVRESES